MPAAILSGAYFLFALAWIVLTGRFALSRAVDVELLARFEFYKGLIFITLSALFVFALSIVFIRRLHHDAERMAQGREALLRSEQRAMAGLFASTLAHDGNNLVAVIRPNVRYVRTGANLPPMYEEALADVDQAAQRLTEMFRRLRDAARRNVDSPSERLHLSAVVGEAVAMAQQHLSVKHCEVQLEGDPEVALEGQPALIHQMVLNLVLNAAEATDGQGRVEVLVFRQKKDALIEVHDDGPGIPPNQRGRIFEAFFTSKKEGTGLGLVSVRACVESHGGEVAVTESSLGGACFRVRLPLERVRPAESLPPPARAVPGRA